MSLLSVVSTYNALARQGAVSVPIAFSPAYHHANPLTSTENKYPHSFENDDSKGNKLKFPNDCPADTNRQEFPLVSPPPYDGGKNNVKQGDERVVYYWTPGDIDYTDNPNVKYCGIMTHVGAPTGGFILC